METRTKLYTVGLIAITLLLVFGLSRQSEAKEPVKSQAVIELEKEMKQDVAIYNQIAPRLSKDRKALEALGWSFDDSKMTAVFQ